MINHDVPPLEINRIAPTARGVAKTLDQHHTALRQAAAAAPLSALMAAFEEDIERRLKDDNMSVDQLRDLHERLVKIERDVWMATPANAF